MDPRTCRACVVGIWLAMWLGGGSGTVLAGQTAGTEPGSSATRHVRPLRRDHRVESLLQEAPQRSQTVARLLAILEQSDVLVWVELRQPIPHRSGQLTMISANHGYRYLAVSLDSRNIGDDLIVWLGHELMHAVEVAATSEVQDARSMRRFFGRVACSRDSDGGFETTAAVNAGRAVRAEVWQTVAARPDLEREAAVVHRTAQSREPSRN